MANFLSRLAARATGTANVARPIVPTVFSSESGLERSEPSAEIAAERLANPSESRFSSLNSTGSALLKHEEILTGGMSPSGSDEPRSRFHPLYEDRHVHHESLPLGELRTPSREQAVSLPSAPNTQPAEDKTYVPDRASRSLTAAENVSSSSELIHAPTPNVAEAQPGRTQQSSAALSLARTLPSERGALSPRQDQMVTTAQEAPVVRVTIGRIDVRAQFSSPAPQASNTRHQRPPALSLEEYLKQRREGRR